MVSFENNNNKLERFLASEDEWYEDCNDPATRAELTNEVRALMSQLQNGMPGLLDQQQQQRTAANRRDSGRTISTAPNRFYSGDSDADDEGTADEAERKSRDEEELSLSQGSSPKPPLLPGVLPTFSPRDVGSSSDDDDDDDDLSIKGDSSNHPGVRTPPQSQYQTQTHKKRDSTDTVGRYEALFSSLETPRALPVMTPMEEDDPLPAAFAKLQAISPHAGKIGAVAPGPKGGGDAEIDGPVPKLDIEGWRASKDDNPDTWCCE